MYIKISWDQDFQDLMMHLWAKYGRGIFTENGIGDQLDLNKFSKDFFNNNTTTADVSIDDNSNVNGKSVIDYSFEFLKPLQKYNSHYLLWKQLKSSYGLLEANTIIEKQINGEIYINDFSDIGKPYCFNYSTYDVALMGLTMSKGMIVKPPKSLESFIRQMEQFVVYCANSTLGATGIADVLIVAGYFVDKIEDTGYDGHILINDVDIYVSEKIRSFIYTLNWKFRGNQSPFTNISIYDNFFLEELAKDYIMLDGKSPKIETIKRVQKLFVEAMNDELERSELTFPIVTACISTENGEIKDESFLEYIAEQNMKFGFINMFYGKSSVISGCCRLRSDKENEYFNSFGAGSTKIGSLGVVTQNFPRLAYLSLKEDNPKEEFLRLLSNAVRTVAKINNCKRSIIKKRIELNAMPLYSLGIMDLSKQYSTFGVNGLNEALEILGYDITSQDGEDFVIELLDLINLENDKMAKRFKSPHSCEQTPSESSAVKLANRDKLLKFQDNYHLYSNQFIPLTTNANMLERIRLQGKFDNKFSGGAVCHINVGEEIKDKNLLIDLMKFTARAGVIYWSVNYLMKRCKNNHVFIDGSICPTCGSDVDRCITRCVGFFTNVSNWSKVRREIDFPKRQFYKGLDK